MIRRTLCTFLRWCLRQLEPKAREISGIEAIKLAWDKIDRQGLT